VEMAVYIFFLQFTCRGGMLDVEYFCSEIENPYNYAVCCM